MDAEPGTSHAEIGQTALSMDRYLTETPTAERRAAWDQLLELEMPAGLARAYTTAERGAAEFASRGRLTKTLPPSVVPEWVRLGVLNEVVTWTRGAGSTCMHAPSPERPEAIFIAAWKPGFVACGRCLHFFARRPILRCDGCGNNKPLEDRRAIQVSFATFVFHVCEDCTF